MRRTQQLAAVADVMAKAVLVALLVLVLVDPTWGNLEGKAPVVRAFTYPLWALAVPLVWLGRGRPAPYPWLADLLVTLTAFSDVLGNRLDLYDGIVWFDDFMHLLNSALVAAAFLLLFGGQADPPRVTVSMAIAAGVTVSLVWEVFEYVSFLTRSPEWTTAYQDTMGDLMLGWLGAVSAGLLVAGVRRLAARRTAAGVAGRPNEASVTYPLVTNRR
jgi:hypothetical protein